ncbi:MAG: CsbD family protein [Nocardioidaceae bacterium]|nr:CsbD family protein [Nocardioidaceae bacterium]
MGAQDKISNTADKAAGKVKETAGDKTDDQSLKAEGKGDQSKADLKQAGEKAKDAFKK